MLDMLPLLCRWRAPRYGARRSYIGAGSATGAASTDRRAGSARHFSAWQLSPRLGSERRPAGRRRGRTGVRDLGVDDRPRFGSVHDLRRPLASWPPRCSSTAGLGPDRRRPDHRPPPPARRRTVGRRRLRLVCSGVGRLGRRSGFRAGRRDAAPRLGVPGAGAPRSRRGDADDDLEDAMVDRGDVCARRDLCGVVGAGA